tara:strand:- start:1797 stop:3323 length:1527 start_codon:yes stop_codon:yes gene_type:complete
MGFGIGLGFLYQNPIILALIEISFIIDNFKSRVAAEAAVFEAEECLTTTLTVLNGYQVDPDAQIVRDYATRVRADGGTVEGLENTITSIKTLNNSDLHDKASLSLFPSGVTAGKAYSILPTNGAGDFDVIRSTTKTRTNRLGLIETVAENVSSLNYDIIGGEPSILLEPQRTNLIAFSEDFNNGNYNTNNSTLTTALIINPKNVILAHLFKLNSGANIGNSTEGFNFGNTTSLISATQYTQSIFAKPFGSSVLRLRSNVNAQLVDFTLTGNGVAPIITGSLQRATIELIANGWYRCSWTFTTTSTVPGNRADHWTIKTNIADGVNGLYVFGAQVEQGAHVTSYIPTSGSAVTRNQDTINKTGIGSDIINPGEGTFYIVVSGIKNEPSLKQIAITDGTQNNKVIIRFQGGQLRFLIVGVAQGTLTDVFATSLDITTLQKCLLKWGPSGQFAFLNGVKYTLTGNGFLPNTLSGVTFDDNGSINFFYGKCESLQIYKTALTDAECVTLTTT